MGEIEPKIPLNIMLEINEEKYMEHKDHFDGIFQQILDEGNLAPYDWPTIHPYIVYRLQTYCDQFYNEKASNLEQNEYSESIANILQLLHCFTNHPPFTLQRICELISHKNPYSSSKAHLNAILKMVNIEYNCEEPME